MNDTQIIHVEVGNVEFIYIEVDRPVGEQNVGNIPETFSMDAIKTSIKNFGNAIVKEVKELKPDKLEIEFGFDFSIENGQLIALLAKSGLNTSIKVKLQWEKK